MTAAEQISEIAAAMKDDRLPADIRDYEVTLASLLWSVNLEVTRAEIDFRKAVNKAEGTSAARRKQIAEAGPEYERLLFAKTTQESCHQMLMTCRSSLRSLSDEMRLTKG